MKYFMYFVIFAVCFIILCFLIPEYPETPSYRPDEIAAIRLDSTGGKMLVRTKKNDYEFTLPSKALSLALAPLKYSAPPQSSDTPWFAKGDLRKITLNADGSFSANLTVTFMNNISNPRHLKAGLPDEEIARLEKYGFTTMRFGANNELAAATSLDMTGQRHERGSLGVYPGENLATCCLNQVEVSINTPEEMEHNRHLNAMLRPVTMVTEPVKEGVEIVFLLAALLLTGGGLPSG